MLRDWKREPSTGGGSATVAALPGSVVDIGQ